MGRPRKSGLELPPCVYFRHGSYYLVREGKWTNLGKKHSVAIERARELGSVPVASPETLAAFLAKKFRVLKARPATRTGRLKAVTVDVAYVLELAAANDWRCAVTGIPMTLEVVNGKKPYAPSVDRVDCALDYVPGNIRIVCVAANLAMNVWGEEVLLRMTRGIVPRRDRVLDRSPTSNGQAPEEAHG